MTKLKIKYSEIQRIVEPSLTTTVSYLNSAKSKASGLYSPSSFKYSYLINELPTFIKKQKDILEDIKDWLTESNNFYEEAINNFDESIRTIDNIDIKKIINPR